MTKGSASSGRRSALLPSLPWIRFPLLLLLGVVIFAPSLDAASSAPTASTTSSSSTAGGNKTDDLPLLPLLGQRRSLAANGDFAELNELVQDVVLRLLPEEGIVTGSDAVTVTLRNAACTDFAIEDIQLVSSSSSSSNNRDDASTTTTSTTTTTTQVELSLQGLDFRCTVDYKYTFLFTRRGTAALRSVGNAARLALDVVQTTTTATAGSTTTPESSSNVFARNDDNNGGGDETESEEEEEEEEEEDATKSAITTTKTTTSLRVTGCHPDVQISDVDITSGSISALVADVVLRLLRSRMEEQAGDRICRELRDLAATAAANWLAQVDAALHRYSPPSAVVNLLASEQALEAELPTLAASGVELLNFRQADGVFAVREWVREVLRRAVAFLTEPVVVADVAGDDDTETDNDDNNNNNNNSNTNSTTTTLRANALLREHLLDDDGAYHVPLPSALAIYEGHDRLTQTVVTLTGARVYGLDSVTALAPLEAIGHQTLAMRDEIALERLRFVLDVDLDMTPSTRSDSLIAPGSSTGSGNGLRESVQISFGVRGVRASASLFLALNQDQLGRLPLGVLLHSDRIRSCFLSTVYAMEVGGLQVTVDDVEPPVLAGFVSRGMDRIVSRAVETAFLVYEDALRRAFPGLFHVVARDLINQLIAEEYLMILMEEVEEGGDESSSCPIGNDSFLETASNDAFIDFRDLLLPPEEARALGGSGRQPYGDLVSRTWMEVKEQWIADDEVDGSPKINGLIRSIIAEQQQQRNRSKSATAATMDNDPESAAAAAALYLGDVLVSSNSTITIAGLTAQVVLQLSEARIQNLDSFGKPLKILDPISGTPNELNTTASIGSGSKELRFSAKLLLSVSDGKELNLRNEIAIKLDLSTASVMLELMVQILESPFFAVPLRDTLNANCWIAAVLPTSSSSPPPSSDTPGIQVIQQSLNVESLFVDFACVSCSSPDFEELAFQMYSPDRSGNATVALLNLLELFKKSQYLENLNSGIVEMAAKQCPHNAAYDPEASYRELFRVGAAGSVLVEPDRDKRAHFFNVASALIAICFTLLYFVGRRIIDRKFLAWKESASEETLEQLRMKEENESEEEAALNNSTESMFRSTALLPRERYGFPAALILTVGLQLCGHLALLSTVNLAGNIAGEPFAVQGFLEFSFFKALRRAAANGGHEMALLAFLFTGVWPYVKLLTSFCLWFAPPKRLSVSRRGSALLWLDVFAKLSVVDIVTILFAVGAFLIYFGGLDKSLQEDGQSFAVKAIVQPGFGCYTIVMAQRILRVTSRFMLDCHQRILSSAVRDSSERGLTLIATASSSWDYFDNDEDLSDSRSSSSSGTEQQGLSPKLEREDEEAGSTSSTEMSQSRQTGRRINFLTVFAGVTVLLIGVIGAFLAPAISIDTKAVWLIVGSGRTYEQAVSGLPVFRVVTEILLQSRVALDSVRDYVGLGFLLFLVVAVATAYPVMKGVSNFRKWNRRRRTEIAYISMSSGRSSLRASLVRTASTSLEHVRSRFRLWRYKWRLWSERRHRNNTATSEMILLPLYRLKAWRHMEVFLSAFVIACWQLGAVAAYTLHLYCYLMEMIYKSFENLGLVQSSSAQCFRIQLSAPSTVAILCVGFFVLLGSFIFQAVSHYNKIIASANGD